MKNEILEQIRQSRRTYYSELNNLNKTNSKTFEASENNHFEDKGLSYFEEIPKLLTAFNKQFHMQYRNTKFPRFNTGISIKNIKWLKSTRRFKFLERINQHINEQADRVIGQFYELGSKIFEDNNDAYYPPLEAIQVNASDNIFGSRNNFLLKNEFEGLFSKESKIARSLKKIQKNVMIYLEADSFTFNKIPKSISHVESKEISYDPKSGNSAPFVKECNTQQVEDQSPTNPLKRTLYKVILTLNTNSLIIRQKYSNLHKKYLYPIINRFI